MLRSARFFVSHGGDCPRQALRSLDSNPDKAAIFSGSHGLVRISASDGAQTAGDTGEADLGTQFAFATSLHGDGNRVQVSGDLGYSPAQTAGSPTASFRTTYSRNFMGTSPAVSAVTARQLFVPFRTTTASSVRGPPTIARRFCGPWRSAIRIRLSSPDSLTAEYGLELDMISKVP